MWHHREYEQLEVMFIKTGLFPFCKKGSVLRSVMKVGSVCDAAI